MTLAEENELRMAIAGKAHAILYGDNGLFYAVEWNGKSYSGIDPRSVVDKVIADIKGK